MSHSCTEILIRAGRLLEGAEFERLAPSSVREYRRVAARLLRRARMPDGAFVPLASATRNTARVERAAWRRLSHVELASAVDDLRHARDLPHRCLRRIRRWTAELDALAAAGPWRAPDAGARPSRSKRTALAGLPSDWVDIMWARAVAAGTKHLTAIAILTTTGCRAWEVCQGAAVRVGTGGTLEIGIAGAKVRSDAGQPWRRLQVVVDHPAAEHLLALAIAAGGTARVRANCTPNALSMCVAHLAGDTFARRISCHDFRHQRASDVRTATGGDAEACARWLGHLSTGTARYYGRLPRGAGLHGPTPVSAEAPRPVRTPGFHPTAEQAIQTPAL